MKKVLIFLFILFIFIGLAITGCKKEETSFDKDLEDFEKDLKNLEIDTNKYEINESNEIENLIGA